MAQLPLNNGANNGTFRGNLVTMFTEIYAFITAIGTRGAANGVASLGSDAKVPQGQMTGKLAVADLTDGVSQLAAKLNNALGWDGTTPNLQSGVSPVAPFGSNSFIYTGTGSPTLDGSVYTKGDLAIWGMGGTATFTKIPGGGAYLGVFANTGSLPTASTNVGCMALVGASAPYTVYSSNGSAWVQEITSAQVGAASGVASLDGAVHLLTAQLPALTGDVTSTAGAAATTLSAAAPALNQLGANAQTGTAYTLVLTDAGQSVDISNASANTITIPPNSSVAFPINTVINVTQVGAGTTTIAAGAGVTINKPSARTLSISAQLESAWLRKTATDTWTVICG